MSTRIRWAAFAPALLLAGCATTTTTYRSYEAAPPPPPLEGRVQDVREVVRRTEGNPGGGAVAGGVIGGLLGGAITGRPGGAVLGALGGAATGAAVSQGSSEQRWWEVVVRFDDGSWGRIDYRSPPPWRVGDRVRQSPQGLAPAAGYARPRPAPTPSGEPPAGLPPPPPAELPPPPG